MRGVLFALDKLCDFFFFFFPASISLAAMSVSLISVEILDLCSQLNPHAGTPAFLFFRYGFKLTFQLIPRSSHLNACQASFSVIE